MEQKKIMRKRKESKKVLSGRFRDVILLLAAVSRGSKAEKKRRRRKEKK